MTVQVSDITILKSFHDLISEGKVKAIEEMSSETETRIYSASSSNYNSPLEYLNLRRAEGTNHFSKAILDHSNDE
eukprot:Awhi_evm1s12908